MQHNQLKTKINIRLRLIAGVLKLNANSVNSIGLLNGKMGIAIFFYNYSRYSGDKIFENYAGELLDEIFNEINTTTPMDFNNGLTGIGWGIEYLIKNKFVQVENEDTLIDLDNFIYHYNLLRPLLIDNSIDVYGFGHYFISRLSGHEFDDDNLHSLFKKQHLIYLTDDCERILVQKSYCEYNIDKLSVTTISSLTWFLLEMHRMGIFPYKVEKLFKVLPGYFKEGLAVDNQSALTDQLAALAEMVMQCVKDNGTKENIKQITDDYLSKGYGAVATGEELANSFICSAWQQVVYGPYCFTNNGNGNFRVPFEEAFAVIDNEDNWNKRLDGLNNSNMGLTGLAGIGMGMMAKSEGRRA